MSKEEENQAAAKAAIWFYPSVYEINTEAAKRRLCEAEGVYE